MKPLQRSSSFGAAPTRSWVGVSALEFEGAAAQSRARIDAWIAELSIPAAAVAVSFEGRIVWSEAFGFADLERGFPATPRTRFALAGLSPIFAAALDARLGGAFDRSPAERAELARREIVESLGLAHTELEFASSRIPEWSVGYELCALRSRTVATACLRSTSARSELVQRSTAEDLARFCAAHLPDSGSHFLDDARLKALFASGAGWSVVRDEAGRELRRAGASITGATSLVALHPSERTSYAVLANLGLAGEFSARIAACLEPFLAIDVDRASAARRRTASSWLDESFREGDC